MPYQVMLHKGTLSVLEDGAVVGNWAEGDRDVALIHLGTLVGNVPEAVGLLKKAKTACCTNCAAGKTCVDDVDSGKEKTAYDMNDDELLELFNHVKEKVSTPTKVVKAYG